MNDSIAVAVLARFLNVTERSVRDLAIRGLAVKAGRASIASKRRYATWSRTYAVRRLGEAAKAKLPRRPPSGRGLRFPAARPLAMPAYALASATGASRWPPV